MFGRNWLARISIAGSALLISALAWMLLAPAPPRTFETQRPSAPAAAFYPGGSGCRPDPRQPPIRAKDQAQAAGCLQAAEAYRIQQRELLYQAQSAQAASDASRLSYDQGRSSLLQGILLFWTLAATAYAAWGAFVAARAAQTAADAIPILERPYVYSVMVAENVSQMLAYAIHSVSDPAAGLSDADPVVTIKLKNYGKTPAILLNGEIALVAHHTGGLTVTNVGQQWPIKYKPVIGEMDETDAISYKLAVPLMPQQARDIAEGSDQLTLSGFVNYADVWGEQRTCHVHWTYNSKLERMTPEHRASTP